MARSVWKGPFVDPSLIKKIEKQKNTTNIKPIKTFLFIEQSNVVFYPLILLNV